MKKHHATAVFSFIFFLFLSMMATLEVINAQPLEFGIQAGGNISSHLNKLEYRINNVDLHSGPTVAVNYQAGIILRKDFPKNYRLQLEPTFIRLGANYDEYYLRQGNQVHVKSKTDLYYIQLPFVMQISTNEHKETVYGRPMPQTTYHLTVGIFGNYLLDADLDGTSTQPNSKTHHHQFLRDYFPDYEGGPLFGLGFEHGQSKKFGIEARAFISLFNSKNDKNLPQNIAATLSMYVIL